MKMKMNLKRAIKFLSMHQPFPDDDVLDQETLDEWQAVREYLNDNPSDECVPLLLNCFGRMDGCGTYCDVELITAKCTPAVVINALKTALRSPNESVRFWCCEIAADFKTPELYSVLTQCLEDEDEGVRLNAIGPVFMQGSGFALPLLRARLQTETHPEVIDLLQTVIARIECNS